jgi:hypothetical protein
MDEETLEKSILGNFKEKSGVKLKKAHFTHRPTMSEQIGPLKLPVLNGKRS